MKTTQPNEPAYHEHVGLTKRELFAAMAMQGLLSRSEPGDSIYTTTIEAVQAADYLINRLNTTERDPNERPGVTG